MDEVKHWSKADVKVLMIIICQTVIFNKKLETVFKWFRIKSGGCISYFHLHPLSEVLHPLLLCKVILDLQLTLVFSVGLQAVAEGQPEIKGMGHKSGVSCFFFYLKKTGCFPRT